MERLATSEATGKGAVYRRCRTDDVVAVEILDEEAQVLLDREGEFMRQCPGPFGAHAFTAFVAAIPDIHADKVNSATTRLVTRQDE